MAQVSFQQVRPQPSLRRIDSAGKFEKGEEFVVQATLYRFVWFAWERIVD